MNEPAGLDGGGGGGGAGGSGRWMGGGGGLASKRGEAGAIDGTVGGTIGGVEAGGVIDPKTCVKPAGSADGFGAAG